MARPTTSPGALPEFMTSPTAADFLAQQLADLSEQRTREAQENGDARAKAFELRTLSRAAGQQQRLAQSLLAGENDEG